MSGAHLSGKWTPHQHLTLESNESATEFTVYSVLWPERGAKPAALASKLAPDGTLTEILGVADVQSGCKNSSIGLSADGSRLYYLDIQKGRVLVMEKKS